MEPSLTAVSRRTLLASFALVGTAACGVACTSGGRFGDSSATQTSAAGSAEPLPTQAETAAAADALLIRQLERATFGMTPALLAQVRRIGFEAWLDVQLSAATIGELLPMGSDQPQLLAAIDAALPPSALPGPGSAEERNAGRAGVVTGVGARVLLRAAFAPDQLRARVVDFFSDRLHVSSVEVPTLYGLNSYDQLLRSHALGRFDDLLLASATSASMLWFLDNAKSRADHGNAPNENFARELLELHTVGVGGGYDEADVVEVAHVFSGWSLARGGTDFTFRPEWHDLGTLATGGDVLGWRPDEPGEQAGRSLLTHLAHHPATAQRLVHGLARHFVGDDLASDHPLVVEGTRIYLEQDTAVAPVVRHLLTAEQFASSATLMARRPIDLLATTLRRADPSSLSADPMAVAEMVVGLSAVLGQLPYGWPAPDGYPTSSAAWTDAGAVISRWNALATLASAAPDSTRWPGLTWSELGSTRAESVLALCGPEIQLH